MAKKLFPKSYKVYFSLFILFLILIFILPTKGKFNYNYKRGNTWMYETLVAQYDFPLLKSFEQIETEKGKVMSNIIPYYRNSGSVLKSKLNEFSNLDFGEFSNIKPIIRLNIISMYERGIFADNNELNLEGSAYLDSKVVYVEKDRKMMKYLESELNTVKTAQQTLKSILAQNVLNVNTDSLALSLGLYDLLSQNLFFDEETTEMVKEDRLKGISPTLGVKFAGDILVYKGDVITAEIEQILDSYKAEYAISLGYDGPIIFRIIANAIFAVILIFLLFISIYYTNFRIFEELNKYLYLLVIFSLSAITAIVVDNNNPNFLYLVPFSIFALYLLEFFKKRVVLPVYIISLLPLLIFTHNGGELFVMSLVAGVVAITAFQYFNRGWQQFISASIVFLSLLLTYITFRLIDGVNGLLNYKQIFSLFISSFLLVAAYPLIYLFEKIFMLVSNTRLMELCDTSNKLLRDLANKAPGSFQHSLQVMNIADAAARSIGADVLLVRAGAMYHDIGKMMNPLCFIENQQAGSLPYHKDLSYLESAADIIRHVPDGIILADKAKLPQAIKNFILSHHGTTAATYFMNKYINEGGDIEKLDEFYYKGNKPSTKEEVILMFADTVEAASRSLSVYSPEKIATLVDSIITAKMVTEQLEDADITLREINILRTVLKDYISQIHHGRIAYPKLKKNKNNK